MPYLILDDVCVFSEFAQEVFGAEEKMRHTEDGSDRVVHLEVTIGDSTIMAGEYATHFHTFFSFHLPFVNSQSANNPAIVSDTNTPQKTPECCQSSDIARKYDSGI